MTLDLTPAPPTAPRTAAPAAAAAPPAAAGRGVAQRLTDAVAVGLGRRWSRRGFLTRAAVVGSAAAVSPWTVLVRPVSAYATICGPGAACGDGWTVFCCTVNNGVNQCPPGTFAGGWWKADASSWCGGHARYYIDCQAECTHCGCGGGSPYCAQGCWNCTPHCGPTSSCDQRRVCANVFRYGQCNTQIGCSGPVACRMVSCVPPYQVPQLRCGTSSATDPNTAEHSAPCLTSLSNPVTAHYYALQGPAGFLGLEDTPVSPTAHATGSYQRYQNGMIHYSSHSGAHATSGAILALWSSLHYESGPLGYPVTDATLCADKVGHYQTFAPVGSSTATGSIYYRPSTGAHAVWGPIRTLWSALHWENGPLGYPVSTIATTADGHGHYAHFSAQGSTTVTGSIYTGPVTGTHALWGPVHAHWVALRYENGVLGYPATDLAAVSDKVGSFCDFRSAGATAADGSIYTHPQLGTFYVRRQIRAAWLSRGGATGSLGYPTSDERPQSGSTTVTMNSFQHGVISYDSATGQTSVVPA